MQRNVGVILMVLGALAALMAFNMETTVYSSGTYIGGEIVGGGSTHNLGLLQKQMMVLHTALAAFVAGAFLFGSAAHLAGDNIVSRERTFRETDDERDVRIAKDAEDEEKRSRLVVVAVFGVLFLLIALAVVSG